MTKKLLATIFIFASVLFGFGVFATPAHAAFDGIFNDACNNPNDSSVCHDQSQSQSTTNNLIYGQNGIITKIITLLSFAIGVAAVIVIIFAGIRFITSGGDATKVATAKSTILYAVIGLVVAALAQSLVVFVLNKL